MRDLNESITSARMSQRAFAGIVLVLATAVAWMPGPPAASADDTLPGPAVPMDTIDVGDTPVLLVYTEDVEPPEFYRGGGMIGVINSIFAGEVAAPLTAFFRVSVSAKVQINKDAPWRVSLILGQSERHIGNDIQQAPNLGAEADFMMSLLDEWHKDLSEEDAQQLRELGSLDVEVVGPMDALQTWTGPDTIMVTVRHEETVEVRDIRFMRKTEDSGFVPIHLVLLYEAFYVEARYETPPEVGEEVVTLNTQQVVVRQTAEDPKIYRSGELYLSPPPEEISDESTAQ